MDFDVSLRSQLVSDLLTHLGAAVPGLDVLLRGSLAENRADVYSDIDLLWDVPDGDFAAVVAGLPETLASVRPLASLRLDPDFQGSARRRLVFVRFAGVPLFWRIDLDIFAASVSRDPDHDRGNPAAYGTDWSLAESALMNAVAVLKAQRRGRSHEALGLLERAEDRAGIVPASGGTHARLVHLVTSIARQDATTRSLAAEILSHIEGWPSPT